VSSHGHEEKSEEKVEESEEVTPLVPTYSFAII
jgi:hypothetical protein